MSDTIWDIVRGNESWLSASGACACRVVACYNYLKALKEEGILDPEMSRKKTLSELARALRNVQYQEPINPCIKCSAVGVREQLIKADEISEDFSGLCLDCMHRSVTVDEDSKEVRAYWYATNGDQCSFRHGRATWVFSWINELSREEAKPSRLTIEGWLRSED